MTKLSSCAALLAFAAPLAAQPDHFESSPQGFEGVEGNLAIDLIGREPLLRFQQVDAFTYGARLGRNRIYFRRDGLLPTNPSYGARTVEMEFAHGEGHLAATSISFAENFRNIHGRAPQVVLNRKPINFPNWSVAPALPPQPESAALIIFTDVVGWGYSGRSATGTDFVWQVRVWASSKAGSPYPMDGDSVIPTSVTSSGAVVGTGCTATGQPSSVSYGNSMSNYGTSFDLEMNVINCEPGQNAFALLGATQVTASIGLCVPLQLVPLLTVAMGPTDPTGRAEIGFLGLAHNAALIGQPIVGQAVAFDSLQGLVLSQGRVLTVPANPPVGNQVKHVWALDPDAMLATSGVVAGGIILHSNHP